MNNVQEFVAFAGHERLAQGSLLEVAVACKAHDEVHHERTVVYDANTGNIIDVELSGSANDVRARYANMPSAPKSSPEPRGPGRPRLGVVSREVSLLPRHWNWLAEQRGGASATIRRLVDAARKQEEPQAQTRRAVEAAHRFIWDIAGDLPSFEEATRALFAHDFVRLRKFTRSWPAGIRDQLFRFLEPVHPGDNANTK